MLHDLGHNSPIGSALPGSLKSIGRHICSLVHQAESRTSLGDDDGLMPLVFLANLAEYVDKTGPGGSL
jgi:hypothetical protein